MKKAGKESQPGNGVDLKAEAIAAELIYDNYSADQLFFIPLGGFHRSIRSDVEEIETEENAKKDKEKIVIKLNRNGLYDALPEGIFHKKADILKNTESIVEEIKKHRKQEVQARKFFAPFENELFHLRLMMELEERSSLSSEFKDLAFFDPYIDFWGIPKYIEVTYIPALLELLPLVHKARGIPELAAWFMEKVLKINTEISKQSITSNVKDLQTNTLGTSKLNRDFILSAEGISESGWEVKIGPVPIKRLADFLPGNKGDRTVHYLLSLLAPLSDNYSIEIESEVPEDSEDENSWLLGYSTILQETINL